MLLEDDLRLAQAPLFAEGIVEAIEWTIDCELGRATPPWVEPLLDHYAAAGALYGHGVHFSPLSAIFEPRQAVWLEQAKVALGKRRFQHVSEHFGFMTTPGMTRGVPLPVPYTKGALAVGRDRLARLREVTNGAPIGLENLALAMSRDDAMVHGEFLDALLEPHDGFLLLDLHNLYCQAHNFEVAFETLLDTIPLERVREIHVSGGSWHEVSTPAGPRPFRRDTHDDDVPDEVFTLLELALPRCPGVEVVFLERLGGTLEDATDGQAYREDYRRLVALVTRVTGRGATHG
jgi:uncharacterized protein (UPF0276 family)